MSEEIKSAVSFAIDDLSSISENPDDWVSQYVAPIKNISSYSKVNLAKTDKETDPLSKMTVLSKRNESRAHAFLRYMGFPIVSPKSKQFYNPGFDPNRIAEDENVKNINIEFNSSDLKQLMYYRETDYLNRTDIFVRSDNESSLYALALRFIKPFNVLDSSKGPLDIDKQTGTIESRSKIIDDFYNENSLLKDDNISNVKSYLSSKIPGRNLTQYRHVLKPFVLDPDVTKAVNPPNKEICAPFLENTEEATRNGPNAQDQLYRPKNEEIIRGRLATTFKSDDSYKTFFNNIKNIYENKKSPPEDASVLDYGTLRATIVALADKNDADKANIDEIFGEFTPIQIVRVSYYIKLIKVAIKVLFKSINTINEVLKIINWVPLPDPDGPEYLNKARIDQKKISNITDVDKAIADCRAAKAACEATVLMESNLNFPPPKLKLTNQDNREIFNQRLRELEGIREKLSAKAFIALKNIEIITGEISGLGIIDIWAVHAAMWSLDEKSLINLLDDRSFNRMILFNTDLRTETVVDRFINNTKQNIETTLSKFENLVINILSFADKEFERQFDNPLKKEGGGVAV